MRRPTAMTVVPVQRTTSTESSTGPTTMVEFVHFSMLTDLSIYKHLSNNNIVPSSSDIFANGNWN